MRKYFFPAFHIKLKFVIVFICEYYLYCFYQSWHFYKEFTMRVDKKEIANEFSNELKNTRNYYYHYDEAMKVFIRKLESVRLDYARNRYINSHDDNADLIDYLSDSIVRLKEDRKTMANHMRHHERSLRNLRMGRDPKEMFSHSLRQFSMTRLDSIKDRLSDDVIGLFIETENAFSCVKDKMFTLDLNYSKERFESLNRQNTIVINPNNIVYTYEYIKDLDVVKDKYQALSQESAPILEQLKQEIQILKGENNHSALWLESIVYDIEKMHTTADRLFISNDRAFQDFESGKRSFAGPFWHGTVTLGVDDSDRIMRMFSKESGDGIRRIVAKYNEFDSSVKQLNEKYTSKLPRTLNDHPLVPSLLSENIATMQASSIEGASTSLDTIEQSASTLFESCGCFDMGFCHH